MDKRPRWWNDRALLLVGVGTGGGLSMVAAGWVLQGRDYVPNLLLQIGSSLLLVIPLVVLNRLLEKRLRQTERRIINVDSQVRKNAARLNELSNETLHRLRADAEMADELIDNVVSMPNYSNVRSLLGRAWELKALDPDGFRVRLVGMPIWLQIRDAGDAQESLSITIQDAEGASWHSVTWQQHEKNFSIFESKLISAIRNLSPEYTKLQYELPHLLSALLNTVRIAVYARTGVTGDLGTIIEVVNDQWVISSDGLRCRNHYYLVPRERILDPQEDWVQYMTRKPWVNKDNFAEACAIAAKLYRYRSKLESDGMVSF